MKQIIERLSVTYLSFTGLQNGYHEDFQYYRKKMKFCIKKFFTFTEEILNSLNAKVAII